MAPPVADVEKEAPAVAPVPAEPAKPAAAAKPAPPAPKLCEMYIPLDTASEDVRCDLHPLFLLDEVEIEIPSQDSKALPIKVKAQRCPREECNRHYLPEYGYFPFVARESLNVGEMTGKPKCPEHELGYMSVRRIHGEFVWACPEPHCKSTAPYVEPPCPEPVEVTED